MTITLIRHAPVIADWEVRLYADELEAWIARYDTAPIDTTPPTNGVDEAVASAHYIVASSLRRTADSLSVLGTVPDRIDPLFDEAPVPNGTGHWLRLRPMQWLSYFRFRALVSWMEYDSPMRHLTHRANQAAETFIHLANTHEHVVLMGHGAINHFIARALKQHGWQPQTDKKSKGNWGYVVLGSEVQGRISYPPLMREWG